LALVEYNGIFCNTLRHNRNWEVIGPPSSNGDVSKKEDLAEQLEGIGVSDNFEGVFIGGPPCQPFSIASNQRYSKDGENFKRTGFDHQINGNLLFDYIWFILKFKPKVFLIENVTGLIDLDGGQQVGKAYELLKRHGYYVNEAFKVNAADYGVPQQRERVL
jgi:DNA (cytosine-5)-methyltransferase 1